MSEFVERAQAPEKNSGLSKTEERALIHDYRRGLDASQWDGRWATKEERERLIALGQQAEQRLISSHLPLVRALAWGFYSKNRTYVEYDELVAAGNEGLWIALQKFKLSKGARFSTYASWWISNKIRLAIREARWMIRIPDHVYKELLRVLKFIARFTHENFRPPSHSEMGQKFGKSEWYIRKLLSWNESQEVSLSTPIGDDGVSTLEDIVVDWSNYLPSEVVTNAALRDQIERILRTLTPREEKVIRMRFGFEEGGECSLSTIGEVLELHGERVRQVEVTGIRKLRHPARSARLIPFLRQSQEYRTDDK